MNTETQPTPEQMAEIEFWLGPVVDEQGRGIEE